MKNEIEMSSKTKLAANSFTRSFIITAAVPFFIVGLPLFVLSIISIYFGKNSVVHHPEVIIRLLSLSPMINSLIIIFVISSNRKMFFKFIKKLIGKCNTPSVKIIKGSKYNEIRSQLRNIIHNKKKVIL
uniref:G-protein coupled receptors family 1 profile domain-containing protein n=1 Tax=Strongyloides venezuelensis TaxID=75913 RepID=A0A0K0EVE9_STRVS